ncbi:MAG: single-stranded DNA-binding protein [Treponema sp.]|jgi:single-strand DNA-binding protein|nr:single-stranded DNA-binding protein [Treponema sp.]
MNNLNSILLEGELAGKPDCQSDKKGNPVCRFTLASSRFFKTDNGMEKETCCLDIETTGKLALQCKQNGREGRGARVVGRLKQEHSRNAEGLPVARILVVAEYVEFRPTWTQDQKQTMPDREDYGMER